MRRHRPSARFIPKLESLEVRSLLSAVPVGVPGTAAANIPHWAYHGQPTMAVGSANGQLAVLGVIDSPGEGNPDRPVAKIVHRDLAARNAVVTLYSFAPSTGTINGNLWGAGQPHPQGQIQTDIPAGPGTRLAFGDLSNSKEANLVVAGPDGHGSVAVELFTLDDSTGSWQVVHKNKEGDLDMSQGPGMAFLGDVNGDGHPDVVLANNSQVGFLLSSVSSGTTQVSYNIGPVAVNPFLAWESCGGASGGKGGIADTKNISDGAAKGQASDLTVADVDGDGQPDLVTALGNQVLFSTIFSGDSDPFPDPPQSIAITLGGSSQPTPAPSGPITGRGADALFVVPQPNGGATGGADLVAVFGNQVYVGIGSKGGGATSATAGLSFTWHVDRIPPQLAVGPLFLGDVDGDGQLDLFSVRKELDKASPALAVVVAEKDVLTA